MITFSRGLSFVTGNHMAALSSLAVTGSGSNYSTIFARAMSSSQQEGQCHNLIIGNGHIGKELTAESLRSGKAVATLTRRHDDSDETSYESFANGALVEIKTPKKNLADSDFIRGVIDDFGVDGLVANTIGTPCGSADDMTFANEVIPQAIAQGVKDSGSDKTTMLHVSSCAAAFAKARLMEGCSYPESKLRGEEAVIKTGLDAYVIVRLPYVLNTPVSSDIIHIDNHHAWAPEHLVDLGIQTGLGTPVIGSGKQYVPVVMTESVSRLMAAVLADPTSQHGETINAVSEYLTQTEMLDKYAELIGADKKKLCISLNVAHKLAKLFPYGHLQSYAIHGLEVGEHLSKKDVAEITDNKSFLSLVDDPETLEQTFSRIQDEGKQVVFSKAPVLPHAKSVMMSILSPINGLSGR